MTGQDILALNHSPEFNVIFLIEHAVERLKTDKVLKVDSFQNMPNMRGRRLSMP